MSSYLSSNFHEFAYHLVAFKKNNISCILLNNLELLKIPLGCMHALKAMKHIQL